MTREWGVPKWAMWMLVATLLVGTAILVVYLVARSSTDEESSGRPDVQRPMEFDSAAAQRLEAALESGDPEVLGEVIAAGDIPLDELAASALPPGGTIDIDATTFDEFDDEVASVEARIGGPQPATVTLFLVLEDDGWRLIGSTRPVTP